MRETVDKELLWVVHAYNTDVVKRKCSTLSLYISKITSRHLANTKNNKEAIMTFSEWWLHDSLFLLLFL